MYAVAANNVDRQPVLPEDLTHDLEQVLPLELIRTHTKTDDAPRVTDLQLELYRQAAFEACEEYTGIVVTGFRTIRQSAETKAHRTKFRRTANLELTHPASDGSIYFFGRDLLQPTLVRVQPGATEVPVPVLVEAIDVSNCCNPCSQRGAENFGLSIMYKTGYLKPQQVPALIKTGALKFIAWMVRNPGDVYQSVLGKARVSQGGQEGTNNTALASGALDDWRTFRRWAT